MTAKNTAARPPATPRAKVWIALGLAMASAAFLAVPASYLALVAWSNVVWPDGDLGLGLLGLGILLVLLAGPLAIGLAMTPAGQRRRVWPVYLVAEVLVIAFVGWVWAALTAVSTAAAG